MRKFNLYLIIFFSFFLFVSKVGAETIQDGEFTINLGKFYFEIYEEEQVLYQEEENGYLKMFNEPIISEEILYNLEELNYSFDNSKWKLGEECDVRLLYLNMPISTYFDKFKSLKPEDDKNYVAVVRLEYNYLNVSNSYAGRYYYKFYENLINSMMASFQGKTLEINAISNAEYVSQFLWLGTYENSANVWKEYNSVETLGEDNSAGLVMNFDVFSIIQNEVLDSSSMDYIYYIHNMPDANMIKSILETEEDDDEKNIINDNNNQKNDLDISITVDEEKDNNIYGTVENPSTGIKSYILLIVLLIIITMFIVLKIKVYNKFINKL